MSNFWLVSNQGQLTPLPLESISSSSKQTYRIYRFLTEIEDVLATQADDSLRLRAIAPKVIQLLTQSDWLQLEYQQPDPKQGWSVVTLYDEPDFPLTVQMVSWASQAVSTTHNHATWGLVGVVDGQEKHTFWRRQSDPRKSGDPVILEKLEELVLGPGDIIGFLPDAIHCVEAVSEEPTVTFNLYGVTDYKNRYVYDPQTQTAELF